HLEELQLAVAVYCGRQSEHFVSQFQKLDVSSQESITQALKNSIKEKVIGGKVLRAVKEILKQL
ncbi:hypothetical protein MJH12_15715, partial [bacterium]|nr:hypothetical protein [bacterium]